MILGGDVCFGAGISFWSWSDCLVSIAVFRIFDVSPASNVWDSGITIPTSSGRKPIESQEEQEEEQEEELEELEE